MHATAECAPNWTRATCCGEVWHEACIHRYARSAESITNTFKCPQCKKEHNVDDIGDWDAAVVVERLFPEDDYSPEESSSDASEEESEDDSLSSDGENSSRDDPPTRKTRSKPDDHDDFTCLTRSKTSCAGDTVASDKR